MSKIIFNEFQRTQLESNQNIVFVSVRAISYKPEFKIKAVKVKVGSTASKNRDAEAVVLSRMINVVDSKD